MLSSSMFVCLVYLFLEVRAMHLVISCTGIKTNGDPTVEITNVVQSNSGSGVVWKGQLKAAPAYWVEIKFENEGEPPLKHQWEVFDALDAVVTDVTKETEGEKEGILRAYYIGCVAAGSSEDFRIGQVALVTDLPGIGLHEFAMKNELSAKEWVRISSLMFRAVKYMHDHNVLHRNVSPAAFAFANSDSQNVSGRTRDLFMTDVRFAKVKEWGVPENGPCATVAFMSTIEHDMLKEAQVAHLNNGNPPPETVETRRADVQSTAFSIYFIWFRVFPWSHYVDSLYAYVNWTGPEFSRDNLTEADKKVYDDSGLADIKDFARITRLKLGCLEQILNLKNNFEGFIDWKLRKGGQLTQPGILLRQMVAFANASKYNLALKEKLWLERWETAHSKTASAKNEKTTPSESTPNEATPKHDDSSKSEPLKNTSDLPLDDEAQEDKPAEKPVLNQTANLRRNLLSSSCVFPSKSKQPIETAPAQNTEIPTEVASKLKPEAPTAVFVRFTPTISRKTFGKIPRKFFL